MQQDASPRHATAGHGPATARRRPGLWHTSRPAMNSGAAVSIRDTSGRPAGARRSVTELGGGNGGGVGGWIVLAVRRYQQRARQEGRAFRVQRWSSELGAATSVLTSVAASRPRGCVPFALVRARPVVSGPVLPRCRLRCYCVARAARRVLVRCRWRWSLFPVATAMCCQAMRRQAPCAQLVQCLEFASASVASTRCAACAVVLHILRRPVLCVIQLTG